MPVITEEKLRKLEKDGVLDQLVIEEKDILTPSAREFLNKKRISYDRNREKKEEKLEIQKKDDKKLAMEEAKPKRQYRDYVTGAIYDKKPEFMTQIFGDNLVVKNHKRIILRGKFDTLQAETIKFWKKYEKRRIYITN